MPTSPTDPGEGALALLVFADAASAPAHWLQVGADGVCARGESGDPLPAAESGAAHVLAVTGEQVAIHWLALDAGLSRPQAAAAARLMLAGAAPEPLADMHVAIGRPERGLTPAALVPVRLMESWLAQAPAPDRIVPTPMLLAPPETGFVRLDRGELADWRAEAAAFTLEPELAAALTGDAPVATLDQADFESALPALLAAPPLDLRQGAYARRRTWATERGGLRRIAALALALALLTLLVQIVTLMRYAFAVDRAEAQAAALAGGGVGGSAPRIAFGAIAAILFDAIRSTPNVELVRLDYRPNGSLTATVQLDNQASLPALLARIEAGGLAGAAGAVRSAGGRPTADVTVRPR